MATGEIERRWRLDKMTPAERVITDAMLVVEEAGADIRLTDAVTLLSAARERVADYVDGVDGKQVIPQDAAELARLRHDVNLWRDAAVYAGADVESIEREKQRGDTYRARARACHQNAVKARLFRIDFDLLSDDYKQLSGELAAAYERAAQVCDRVAGKYMDWAKRAAAEIRALAAPGAGAQKGGE